MTANGRNLRQVGDRVETLIDEMRSGADEPTRARAEELVHLLVDLYGAGLERVTEILAEDGESGQRLLRKLADDRFLASLLVLHSLHPVDVETRIHEALEQVRPYLGSHAGGVEYLGIDDEGIVRLKLQGSCDGCPSSTVTVELAIERAIQEAAPEVMGIEVEGAVEAAPPAPALLQIQPLRRGDPAPESELPGSNGNGKSDGHDDGQGDGWIVLEGDPGPGPGATRTLDIGGATVLLADVEGSVLAYLDACGACGASLRTSALERERLRCPACDEEFDVRRAGRGVGRPELHLQPLPLLQRDGRWSVAMPAGVRA